jgi:hypothetical protein
MEQIFALGDVARLLGVQGYKIAYAISTGALPEASCRLASKRVFTEDDVRRIARHFGVQTTVGGEDDGREGGQ